MAFAGILKLLGDFAGLLGPISISGVILYVANIYYDRNQNEKVRNYMNDFV